MKTHLPLYGKCLGIVKRVSDHKSYLTGKRGLPKGYFERLSESSKRTCARRFFGNSSPNHLAWSHWTLISIRSIFSNLGRFWNIITWVWNEAKWESIQLTCCISLTAKNSYPSTNEVFKTLCWIQTSKKTYYSFDTSGRINRVLWVAELINNNLKHFSKSQPQPNLICVNDAYDQGWPKSHSWHQCWLPSSFEEGRDSGH